MQIKEIPEDFIVIEKLDDDFFKGNQHIYLLVKKNFTTHYAIKKIAEISHLKEKDIRYCGIKDKQALTMQYFSCNKKLNIQLINKYAILKDPKLYETITSENILQKVNNFKHIEQFFYVFYFGEGKRMGLGLHEGNNFIIKIRNFNSDVKKNFMINYFDEQRFSKNNIQVGKLLLDRKFNEAIKLIDERADEKNGLEEIQKKSKRIIQLYLHAFQSYLWNLTVSRYLEKLNISLEQFEIDIGFEKINLNVPKNIIDNLQVSIIGFGLDDDMPKDDLLKETINEILTEFSLTPRSFILRELGGLSLEGGMRDVIVETEVKNKKQDDNLIVEFFLPKGSYATMLIKQIF